MNIFRVEDENREGPYSDCNGESKDVFEWVETSHNDENHPNRFDDNFIGSFENSDLELSYFIGLHDYIFGFESYKQLKEWFSEQEIKNLKELGYNIIKYKIENKYILQGRSKKQIMFLKEKAIKIK